MAQGDSWKTSSGLLDDFEMTFQEVFFGTDPNYQKGQVNVFIVRGDAYQDGEIIEPDYKLIFGMGDGWEPRKNGTEVAHGAGKTQFNRNSGMGRLIDAVVGLGDEVLEVLKDRGEATEAATWQGLRFHFTNVTNTFTDKETKEVRSYDTSLPDEFLGVEEEEKPAAKSRAKAGAKATAKSTAKPAARSRSRAKDEDEAEEKPKPRSRRKAEPEPEPEEDDDLRAAVVEFAYDFDEDDHDEFLTAVYDPEQFDRADEIDEDEDLAAEVMDPDSDLWAEAHA